MAEIGFKIKPDTAEALRSISAFEKKSKSAFDRIRRKGKDAFKKIGDAVNKFKTLIIAAAVAGVGAMIRSVTLLGDTFDKMSLRTGLAVETLGELKFAAEISGASLEDFEKGVKTLAKRVSDARFGLETYQRIFRQLNVDWVDAQGNLRDIDVVFRDSFRAISNLKSATEQAAMAQELFGRAGTKLLPLMKQGEEGLEALMQKGRETGGVFTAMEAKISADFVDALTELKWSLVGLIKPILIPAIEKFTEFAGKMSEIAKSTRNAVIELGKFIGLTERPEGFEFGPVRIKIEPPEVPALKEHPFSQDALKGIRDRNAQLTQDLIRLRFNDLEAFRKIETLKLNSALATIQTRIDSGKEGILATEALENQKWLITAIYQEKIQKKEEETFARRRTLTDHLINYSAQAFGALARGFGQAMGRAIVFGENFGESMKNVFKNILASFISMIAQMTARFLAFKALTSAVFGGGSGVFGKIATTIWPFAHGGIVRGGLNPFMPMSAMAMATPVSAASGGIFRQPTLAMIGDNPERQEAVIPMKGGKVPVDLRGEVIRPELHIHIEGDINAHDYEDVDRLIKRIDERVKDYDVELIATKVK